MAAFAGVLILASGLVLGLFQEARAVSVTPTTAPNRVNVVSSSTTFTFDITVPDGQRLPVESVRTIVEQTDSGPPKTTPVTRVGDATCNQPIPSGCASPSGMTIGGGSSIITNAVTSVGFTGSTPDLAGYGYGPCPGGGCNVVDEGYGYSNQLGFGYTNANEGQGYLTEGGGYGYNGGDLTLTFDVTINPNALGTGDYWITFIVNTGSSTISDIQSQNTHFVVFRGGGGGGVPGGGGGGGAPGTIETGLDRAFTVSQNQRVKIIASDLPPQFLSVLVQFNRACEECTISMTDHGPNPPAGMKKAPGHSQSFRYFNLEVRDSNGDLVEGAISGGSIEFDLSLAELGEFNPRQIAVMHLTNPWEFEPTRVVSAPDADPAIFNATLTGFSEFAIVADTQPPNITATRPTGSTTAVTPSISADFEDNRGIDPDSFTLTLDGTEQTSQMGSLSVSETGFSFVPASSLSQGEHTVEATIEDDSGLSTTESWTFRVSGIECATPPRITNVRPADGASNVGLDATIRVTVQEGDCPIDTSSITVNGNDVTATYADGRLTAPLPSAVGNNETVRVAAQVADTGGNQARQTWSFDTEQAEEPTPTPTEEDGGALVWIIIAIVVLAVIGVGAYFYTEQQGGGRGGAGGSGGPGGPGGS